ncbi:restriction endonuclease subunit S [Oceanihabitans sediminis]|uniref:restriction endonuclease subunit S n=1 Tax=Oceanihabitans sediminis TaxID=1812012 RepID=UPI003A8F9328
MENKLPKNWVNAKLNDLATIQSGGTPSRSKKEYWSGDIPWVKISDLKEWYVKSTTEFITEEGLNNSSTKVFPKGTILFTIFATIGKVGVLDIEACTNQAIAGITPIENIEHKFLTYSLIELAEILQNEGKGVAQKNINLTILKNLNVPLPPLPEQQRIVAKLDELFGHLDTLKTRLENIPQILKNFRQAVLTQAVTGKLTEEWRVGKELEEWEETTLEELVLFAGNGLSKRRGEGEDLTVLRLADFKDARRIYGNERKIQLTEKEQIKYTLNNDDLLIIRVNGSVDLAGLFILYKDEGFKEAYCDHFIRLTVDSDKIIPLYLTYISNNGDGRLYLKNSLSTSAGQNTINQKSVKGLSINLPSLEEQTEIVKRVEHLFSKADAIEAQYQSLKTKIDSLPQAILAKAFKGELVEQLPSDGDAKDLLEDIKKLRESMKKKTVKKKPKKK